MNTRKIISLIATVILLAQFMRAQTPGDSCQYAIDLGASADTSTGYISDNRLESWYAFYCINPTVSITVTSSASGAGQYDKAVLYQGNCGNLVPIDSTFSPSDTVLTINRQFLGVGLYYIKVSQTYYPGCRTCQPDTVTANVRVQQEEMSPWCAFDPLNEFLLATSPGYSIQMTAQDQYIYNYITTHPNIAGPFTIPVVVHVIHYGDAYGSGTNISYDQILWQIAGLNAAFQHDYANYNQEGYGHNYLGYGQQDYSSNPQVRFCLAERGRDSAINVIPFFYNVMSGDTECGVMRYDLTNPMYSSIPNIDSLNSYNITNIADEQTLLDVTRPGTEFPTNMYFNIYLVPEICQTTVTQSGPVTSCNVIGIGTMGTFNSLTGNLDGVVFRSDAFGDNSVAGNSFNIIPALEEGKIMDHEAGHYLALYHTFQPDSAQFIGCFGTQAANAAFNQCDRHGDFCCDTPPDANFTTIPFATTSTLNTCNENYFPPTPATNHLDMNENYMDYSDDNWYNTFTFDQSMRVSAMLDVGGPRNSLVTPSNLSLTGVSDTGRCHCCVLVANIVPAGDSICVGNGMQFVTPTGNAFCATSWSWQFPGGTPSSSTIANPIVTYNTAGTYTVILTATDGVDTVTDTATIHVVNSTVTISATNTNDTVCSGTHQHLELNFTGGIRPYSVTICDQNNNVVATVNNILSDSAVILIPVSDTSNQFFICSATNGLGCPLDTVVGNAVFSVQECCANLFVNGDFEDVGVPGCNIAPAISEIPCGGYTTGSQNTYNPTTNFSGWPIVPPYDGQNGISMVVDCPTNSVHTTPIRYTVVWSQTVSLEQGVQYSFQFDYSSNYGNLTTTNLSPYLNGPQRLFLQFKVNGVFIGVPINVEYCNNGALWHSYVVDWVNTLPTGIDTVSICQVEAPPAFDINFGNGGFDFLLDNISVRAMDIPVALAGADTTICPGGSANIGSLLNDIDGEYLWTPNNFVACDTCFYTTANPNSTNNYVLTNQQRGCIVLDTIIVSVIDVNAGSDIAYCSGGNTTISPTITANPGSYTIYWQPGGQTTDSITVSPSVTTTYIVTLTDTIVNCSVSDTITVYPGNLNVTLSDTTSCIGGAVTLSPTITGNVGSANDLSYLWLPGNQTTPTINVFPLVPTTYTVIVTDSIGCSDTAQATVTPSSVSASVSASPNPACIGIDVDLSTSVTGNGPYSYQWNPTTNLDSTNVANPTIIGFTGSPTTYTVQVTDVNGCVSSAIVTITPDTNCCVAQQYAPPMYNNTTVTGSVAVNQDLTISGVVTFNAVDMPIFSGIRISVPNGATLFITGQSHLYACQQVWNGIDVQPGGTLVINGTSLISPLLEDADTLIHVGAGSTIILNQAIFNKNYFTAVFAPNVNPSAFQITDCRVTSRIFPVTPSVSLLTGAYLTGLSPATMVAPYTGIRPYTGIQATDCAQLNVGLASSGNLNIFDNMDHGIIVYNTNLDSRNNQFQNMLGRQIICPEPPAPCPPHPGIAILAVDQNMVVTNPSTYHSINVGGTGADRRNYFYNCYTAVDVTNYTNVTLVNDTVSSTSTVILPAIVNQNGDHGFFIRTRYSQVMDIRLNGMLNQATGIHLILSGGGAGNQTVNVNKNNISAGLAASTFTNTGILAAGVFAVYFAQNQFLNIDSNRVIYARTCISAMNFPKPGLRIENNPLLWIRPIATAAAGPNQAGILVQNCSHPIVVGNSDIRSLGTTYANPNHKNVRGIYVRNSDASVVACNRIRWTGQSLVFEGACNFSTMRKNDMQFAYDGFVMRGNALIGPQGDATHPIDNKWIGGFVNSQTYTENTTGVNNLVTGSPIWVRPTGVWNPVTNQTNGNPGDQYSPNIINNAFVAAVCPATGNPNGGDPQFNAQRRAIAQNQINYAAHPVESRVMNQKRLWNELQQYPALLVGDTTLQNFSTNNQYTPIGQMNVVEDQTALGNTSVASSVNATMSVSNIPESNQQALNDAFLNTLAYGIDSLTAQQLNDLTLIANQCPEEGGDAVWQARAMLDWVLHTSILYSDSCNSSSRQFHEFSDNSEDSYSQVYVYPNPNSGVVTVDYHSTSATNIRFEVWDVSGRILKSENLNQNQTQAQIDLTEFANGTYVYKFVADDRVAKTGILVISK